MSLSEPLIHCPNSACSNPLNLLSRKFCETCHTLLIHRYLWAAELATEQIQPGELVQGRYQVVASRIWLDTRPDLIPHIPEPLPDAIIPYLRLYPQRLHIPEVYGYAVLGAGSVPENIPLLENVPVDAKGNLMPSIVEAWSQASPVRQVYWLWQILQLWQPLAELGVVSSLLIAENLRVEGWRVRLRELRADAVADTMLVGKPESLSPQSLGSPTVVKLAEKQSLNQLGNCWASWFTGAHRQVNQPLQEIYQQMQAQDVSLGTLAQQLNQLLLEQVAQLPLRLRVTGATDIGPQHKHNEDSCYPTAFDLPSDSTQPSRDPLITHLSIVCDGIGGHEGGEVASQLAMQCLKLQLQALLTEVAEDTQIMTPDLVAEQLAAIIRVVNNLISARNDEQGRESRRRMGTTLVMAFHLPQQVKMSNGSIGNSHELYIAHVGDSRAYWITPQYCQQLTIDDDVATREVRMGRSVHRQGLERPDAGALTQALGTRDAEFLHPTVQRFILEEDGLLLLCSDGLSDNHWVEQSWADYAEPILTGKMSIESAVQSLIDLANQKNGHDNTSVVLSYCSISPEYPVLVNGGERTSTSITPRVSTPDFSDPDKVFMDAELVTPEKTPPAVATPKRQWGASLAIALGLLALLIGGGIVGLTTWWLLNPQGFELIRDRFIKPDQPSATPQPQKSSPVPKPTKNPQ